MSGRPTPCPPEGGAAAERLVGLVPMTWVLLLGCMEVGCGIGMCQVCRLAHVLITASEWWAAR